MSFSCLEALAGDERAGGEFSKNVYFLASSLTDPVTWLCPLSFPKMALFIQLLSEFK